MVIWIDPPAWAAHGRMWSHVISDTSVEELHDFAARAGLPARSFEGDHYDIPAERHTEVVLAGAMTTSGTDLARRLRASGLRFRKRRGERPLGRFRDGLPAVGGPHVLDVIGSPLEPPASSGAAVVLVTDSSALLLVRNHSRVGWAPPGGKREAGEDVRGCAVRELAEETGLVLAADVLRPVGYERITIATGAARPPWEVGDNYIAVFGAEVHSPGQPVAPVKDDDVVAARWFSVPEARGVCGAQPWWGLVEGHLRPG